jgi:hypothetical protein
VNDPANSLVLTKVLTTTTRQRGSHAHYMLVVLLFEQVNFCHGVPLAAVDAAAIA